MSNSKSYKDPDYKLPDGSEPLIKFQETRVTVQPPQGNPDTKDKSKDK